MKIATYNVNGIKSRLPNLLAWLDRERPDIACLQELKALDAAFPTLAIAGAGYQSVAKGQRSWNGVAILARDMKIVPIRDSLPGDPADDHSRYLEAAVGGLIVCCLYLPNGNPQPGPKFDYKLKWFDRLIAHAAELYGGKHPVIIAGDYNVVPTDFDIYDPRSWRKDALLQPESRACFQRLLDQGWVDAIRSLHQDQKIFTFWDYFRGHGNATPACGSTTYCSTRRSRKASARLASTPGCAASPTRATTRPPGSKWTLRRHRGRGSPAAEPQSLKDRAAGQRSAICSGCTAVDSSA